MGIILLSFIIIGIIGNVLYTIGIFLLCIHIQVYALLKQKNKKGF